MYLQPKFFQLHPVLSRPSMDAVMPGCLCQRSGRLVAASRHVWSVRQLSPTIINNRCTFYHQFLPFRPKCILLHRRYELSDALITLIKLNKEMATKIRLQRHGRKGYPFYHIVVADSRAPRDGRFIEKLGTYNPNVNPSAVNLNFDRALYWVMCGAQPTDTARSILSKEGVYMKKHLMGGVRKGAFGEAEAEAKFNAWKNDKQKGLDNLRNALAEKQKAEMQQRLEAEKKVNEAKAKALAEKKAALAAAEAEAAASADAEAPAAEAQESAPAAE